MYIDDIKETDNSRLTTLFVVLCVLTISVGVVQSDIVFRNPVIVMVHEIVFIFAYMILFKRIMPHVSGSTGARVLGLLLALWAVSVTASLLFSPYDLVNFRLAWFRYQQTIMHVLFGLYVWSFLRQYRGVVKYLWLMPTISSLIVLVVFFYVYYVTDLSSVDWFNRPFLNSHIRHTGYQVTAALAALLAMLIGHYSVRWTVLFFLVLALLWGFLFWTGGRAAALSVLTVSILLVVTCVLKKCRHRNLGLVLLGSILLGTLLSELLAVFPWNGLLQGMGRSVAAESLNQLSSNRLQIWLSSWESVKDHILFGLGPQGYFFMPNRVYGVQPHNVILQFIVEWGLIGTILLVVFLAWTFVLGIYRNIVHVTQLSSDRIAAGMVIVALTVHGLVDGTYYHPQPSYYLVLAFVVWLLPGRDMAHRGDR